MKKRILVSDYNPEEADYIKNALEKEGYEIRTVGSISEFAAEVLKNDYSLVIIRETERSGSLSEKDYKDPIVSTVIELSELTGKPQPIEHTRLSDFEIYLDEHFKGDRSLFYRVQEKIKKIPHFMIAQHPFANLLRNIGNDVLEAEENEIPEERLLEKVKKYLK